MTATQEKYIHRESSAVFKEEEDEGSVELLSVSVTDFPSLTHPTLQCAPETQYPLFSKSQINKCLDAVLWPMAIVDAFQLGSINSSE